VGFSLFIYVGLRPVAWRCHVDACIGLLIIYFYYAYIMTVFVKK